MLKDSFGRRFPYIRLSITDVCNFKCGYCLPNGYQKDKSDNRKFLSLEEIEKSVLNADIGLNPSNDGEVIRIPIPPLSEERRKELGKVASKSSEDAKVSIRSHRRFGIDEISKLKDENSADEIKRLESKVQELTDKYVNKIDELLLVKQNELLEV